MRSNSSRRSRSSGRRVARASRRSWSSFERRPDSDRFWLSAGVAWRPTERVRFDVGYAHIFSPEVRIRNPDAVTGHVVRGTYSASADIVGVQLTYGLGWPLL